MKDCMIMIDGRLINLANMLYTTGDKDHSSIVFNTTASSNPLARPHELTIFMSLDKLNQLIVEAMSSF